MKITFHVPSQGLALLSLVMALPVSAAVTPQGWWHYGELADYYADSSGNNRRFSSGFSCAGGGNAGAAIANIGVGGPLGATGFTSLNSLYWTPAQCSAAAMWNPWGAGTAENEWNPPATNYVIEAWILPEETGVAGGANRTWFFASGSGDFSQPTRPSRTGAGGVYFAIDNSSGIPQVGGFVIANAAQGVPTDVQIGDFVDVTTTAWMHVAIVNDNGTNSFYVNGTRRGTSVAQNTIPNGNIFAGGSPGTSPTFRGYLDELRISTFEPGQFATSDLLLRPAGPTITSQPQAATVWDGGAASFTVTTAVDASVSYLWRRGDAPIAGATSPRLYLPTVKAADNGATFACVLTGGGITVTSAVVTLTVVSANASDTANANAYRSVVQGESSLAVYYPADNCAGETLTNVVDSTLNGTLALGAIYDGQTNRALIQRALAFNVDGHVGIPANSVFDFQSGNGTVEALATVDHATLQNQTLFSVAWDDVSLTYALMVGPAGNSLIYSNATETLSWSVAPSLIGRRAHLAFVFNNGVNVTPYLDGQPLETKTQTGFGPAGASAWIGAFGGVSSRFAGTIGELAVYRTALPASSIQAHYTKYIYGTNVAPPSVVSQTVGPKTVLAGSAPVLNVVAAGALPFTYQWKSNGVAIAGATTSALTVTSGAAGSSATYTLSIANVFGSVETQPIQLDFVAPTGAYAQAVATDRPSSYWRLNETTGTVARDLAGFNDAAYVGAVGLGAAGAFLADSDTAMTVSGGAHAEAPFTTTLNPSTPFTIEFLAKPGASGQQSTCVIGSQNRAIGRSGYAIYQGLNGAFWEAHLGDATTVQLWMYGKTVPEAGQWYHVVLVYDPSLPDYPGRLYVNGVDDLDYANSQNNGSLLPNSAAKFEIGSRYGGGVPFNGAIDDVAFYNYALSLNQVSNHWKFTWTTSSIAQQPANVPDATEHGTITLAAAVSGYPNTYQWYKDGVALQAKENYDGTAHYPQGVNSSNLVISVASPSDAGRYHLVISNPLGNLTTADATVAVAPDTLKPTPSSAVGFTSNWKDNWAVSLVFSEPMDTNTLANTANYSLSGGLTLQGVTVNSFTKVTLRTSAQTDGAEYTITVNGVKDLAASPNTIAANSQIKFKGLTVVSGKLLWEVWPGITGNDVASLVGDPAYPFYPADVQSVTNFWAGNYVHDIYGSRLSGWVTPSEGGAYTFFLASDDASQLYLSPDSNPANAVLIAEEPGCCHGFVEPGAEPAGVTSAPVTLTAGKIYFIYALQKDGGGGNYVQVAWRKDGDSTAAASLSPIAGNHLSSYAPLPSEAGRFGTPTLAGSQVTLTWTGQGKLQESTDLHTWTDVAGNPATGYKISPTGAMKFYRLSE